MSARILIVSCIALCVACSDAEQSPASNPADEFPNETNVLGLENPGAPRSEIESPHYVAGHTISAPTLEEAPEDLTVITDRDCTVAPSAPRFPGPCSILRYGTEYGEPVYTVLRYGPRGHVVAEIDFETLDHCDPRDDGIDSPALPDEERGLCIPSDAVLTEHTFEGDWLAETLAWRIEGEGERLGETRVVYVSNEQGRLVTMEVHRDDGDTSATSYEYDDQGRVIGFSTVSNDMERRGETQWSDAGPVLETIETLRGNPWSLRQETSYDEHGRVVSIVEDIEGDILNRTFTYATDGSWSEMVGLRPSDPSDRLIRRLTFDARGTLREQQDYNPDTGTTHLLVRYDECGDPIRQEMKREVGEEARWARTLSYDERRRLVREDRITQTLTHSYDEAGNLLSTVVTGAKSISETVYDYGCWVGVSDAPLPPADRGHGCLPSSDIRWHDDMDANPWGILLSCTDPLDDLFQTCDRVP